MKIPKKYLIKNYSNINNNLIKKFTFNNNHYIVVINFLHYLNPKQN